MPMLSQSLNFNSQRKITDQPIKRAMRTNIIKAWASGC